MAVAEPSMSPEAEYGWTGEPSPIPEAEYGWITPEPEPEGESEMFYNSTGNLSYAEPYPEPSVPMHASAETKTVMGAVAAVLGSGIVIQNIVVLYVIARVWPKQNPTITYFIIHLACADLIAGIQFIWFNSIDIFWMITHTGMWVLILCGIWMVTIAASIGGLINFAHLRIHVLKTAMTNQKYSKKRAILSIAFSWILPTCVLLVPPIAGWNCIGCAGEECARKCSQVVFPFTKIYVLILVALLFFSVIWLIFLYTWIFVLVYKKLNSVRGLSSQSCSKETQRHLFNTMMFILILFFVCHFPVAVALTFDYILVEPNTLLLDGFQIILTLSFLNSFLNPLVYYWRMPATRDSFWIAFGQRDRTQSKTNFSSNTANTARKVSRNNSIKNQGLSIVEDDPKKIVSECMNQSTVM